MPRQSRHPSVASRLGLALMVTSLAACATDSVTGNPPLTQGAFTVNASTAWQYVSLSDSLVVSPTPSASENATWDIAFNATNVTLNGGEAGPGGIDAACICQNFAATNDEILAMTPESELADFNAVTTVPTGLAWATDALTPAITGWFTGSGAAAVADSTKTYLVRLSDSLSFAKVRVRSLATATATATSAGQLTLEYAVQPDAASPLGATQTLVVDLTTAGAKRVDLNTGALTTDAAAWDLRLEGFTIRVNGGVSGAGKAGATAPTATTYDATTTAVTAATAYRTDVYAGIFGTNRWYRYNLAGDNRISPTFDVYLVRRGASVFKLQITNYYSATGTPRQISFRYERMAP